MTAAGVTVDTAQLERFARRLADGVKGSSSSAARRQADETASRIRQLVPVRTGALAATVAAVPDSDGAGVTYGGGLRYAAPVAKRTGCVEQGLAAGETNWPAAGLEVARTEAGRA